MRHILPITSFALLLASLPVAAQTPPTPETTFNAAVSAAWGTAGNWDNGVPTTGSSLDDALIADDKTVTMTQTNADNFGSLTLGANAVAQLSVNSNQGLRNGRSVYLNPGSHLNYVSGSTNRDNNVFVISGASPATYTISGALRGSVQGSGDLNLVLKSNVLHRASLSSYSGDMNITSNGGLRSFNTFGSNSQYYGSGTTTFGDQVYFSHRGNTIADAGSVRLEARGTSTYKWSIPAVSGSGPSETITNLIIDSPNPNTSPYIIAGNSGNSGGVRATDTVTFSGTAATIDLRNGNGGNFNGTKRADSPEIESPRFVFGGTGTWTITGSRSFTTFDFDLGTLGMNDAWPDNEFGGGVITTNTDTNISASLRGDAGFIKRGNSRLSVTGETSKLFGLVVCETGQLDIAGQLDGLRVWSNTTLGIGADDVAGDTLEILFPYDPDPEFDAFVLNPSVTINWQYDGATTAGTDYDTIIAEGLNLSGITNLTINGSTLGYTPSNGDTFHIFQGDVFNYNASNITLNMPAVSGGNWELEQDSSGLKVNFIATAPYDVWSGGTFANPFTQTGPTDNQDGDSSLNLSEFAFGTDPTLSDDGPMSTDGSKNGKPTLEPDGATMEFYFVRRDDHGTSGSVSYTVQFSTDLSSFTDSVATPTFVADSSVDSDYEVVKVPFPPGSNFARVRVTSVP